MTIFLVYRNGVVESVWFSHVQAEGHARDTDAVVERLVYGDIPPSCLFELKDAVYEN